MRWSKLGLIFHPDGSESWRHNSALTPTPILIDEDRIRVYAGFRDKKGLSRIGYVDLDSANPRKIISISREPVLDIGRAGNFDENGVILGDIQRHGDFLRMYYIGFQLVKHAKFLAFTGLAESRDGGEHFIRLSEAPILDRTSEATTIRAIHSILYEEGVYKVWYAAGNAWQTIAAKPYPKYNIWYTESSDGLHFDGQSELAIDVLGQEYRIGRPSVYRKSNQYYMFYTKATKTGEDYNSGLAISKDGRYWQRQDEQLGLTPSSEGFDSKHLCYPRLIEVGSKTYCVYNGNNMGFDGFGLAELMEW